MVGCFQSRITRLLVSRVQPQRNLICFILRILKELRFAEGVATTGSNKSGGLVGGGHTKAFQEGAQEQSVAVAVFDIFMSASLAWRDYSQIRLMPRRRAESASMALDAAREH